MSIRAIDNIAQQPLEDGIPPALLREVAGHFVTGVTIVTAEAGKGPRGCTANAFTSLSLNPPLVLVCLSETSNTLPHIAEAGAFAVNILRTGREAAELGRLFAGKTENKFDGLRYSRESTGAPILDAALAWLDCRLYETYAGGDHSIFIGHVLAAAAHGEGAPLMFYRGDFTPPVSH